jgi:D-alanine-D-alanine ligase
VTPPPDRIRLVVLFGGRSAEHDVSRASASHVLAAIDPDRYDVVPVGITRDGRWQLAEAAAELLGARRELPAAVEVAGPQTDPLALAGTGPAGAGDGGDLPTVVIPVLHGPNGEDGTVQGMLELAGVAYVGAGVLGSAVAMDKTMAKTVLDAHGIPQPRWRQLLVSDLSRPGLAEELLEDLGPVVFVKPANMGSSIGVTRATDVDGVLAGLEEAARYDERFVVEQGIGTPEAPVRELECGVLGNLSPQASVVGEIIPAAEFYDYEDKYHDGAAQTVIPADIDPELSDHIRRLAIRTFQALRAEGMARVDVFLAPDTEPGPDGVPGRVLVNEINTLPGFTPISMFPKLWHASGLPYPRLIDELVRLALERHERRRRFET